jgi:hypothetical protein
MNLKEIQSMAKDDYNKLIIFLQASSTINQSESENEKIETNKSEPQCSTEHRA